MQGLNGRHGCGDHENRVVGGMHYDRYRGGAPGRTRGWRHQREIQNSMQCPKSGAACQDCRDRVRASAQVWAHDAWRCRSHWSVLKELACL
jgi:hypothetical protein